MPVNVRVALLSEDGTVLMCDETSFDPSSGLGTDGATRAAVELRKQWRCVTDGERAEFSAAIAALAHLGTTENPRNEAAEVWRLAGVFGRVNCPHGCKQVAADEECPHGYPSLAKRMGVKF
jgi:hypothetical protein